MRETINTVADWQWNVHAWSKQDSPAAAVNHYLAGRLAAAGAADRAFAWLCYGQEHDPPAVAAYRALRERDGDEALYTAVLTAHGDRVADLDRAATHLEWQAHNDPLSLVAAALARRPGADACAAMFHVLGGQRHNANAGQLYRACLARDPVAFFGLVEASLARLRGDGLPHPYLSGAPAGPAVFRDEVPAARVG